MKLKLYTKLSLYLAIAQLLAATGLAQSNYQKLWFTSYENNQIVRINFDGSGDIGFAANPDPANGPIAIEVSVPHGKVFWTNQVGNVIYSSDFSGANKQTLITNSGYVSQMAIDVSREKLYWSNYEGRVIERSDLDGSNRETVVTLPPTSDGPTAMAIDPVRQVIYWYNEVSVVRANYDGSNIQSITTPIGYITGLAVDVINAKLYMSNYDIKGIEQCNLDGSNRIVTVSDAAADGPIGIALDMPSGRLFWFDQADYTIRSANIGGSDRALVIEAAGYPTAMTIPSQYLSTLPITLASFKATTRDCEIIAAWSVTDVVNFSHFELEISSDGSTFVTAKTITYQSNKSDYVESVPAKGNRMWIRLRMVDIDGKYSYGKAVKVSLTCNSRIVKVYPNPASGLFFIKSDIKTSVIEVFGVDGRRVHTQTVNSLPGVSQEIRVPTSMRPGLYFLKLKMADGSSVDQRIQIK